MSITASVYKKKKVFTKKRTVLAVVERLFWQLGTHFSGRCRCREVAVVERFKQELMYGLSAGTKKCGRCREVAVMERWPLVEVQLYKVKTFRITIFSFTKKQERRTSYVVSFISNKLADFKYNDEAQFIS